jgi:hypothetical protein
MHNIFIEICVQNVMVMAYGTVIEKVLVTESWVLETEERYP